MADYKELNVWQESIDFVEYVYKIALSFPSEERFALADQIKRAVISIPSNIAEGASRNSSKEFIQFLYIALGSAAEVETQLIIAHRLNYIDNIDRAIAQNTKIRKMINALISAIKRKTQ